MHEFWQFVDSHEYKRLGFPKGVDNAKVADDDDDDDHMRIMDV